MKFKDNISPSVVKIFQRATYYGLIEGAPDSAINQELIKNVVSEAQRYFGVKRIYVVVPVEKKRIRSQGREIAELPAVICMAELFHYQPMKDKALECSRLCLIWFQNEYSFPIDNEVLKRISELEWKSVSEDGYL